MKRSSMRGVGVLDLMLLVAVTSCVGSGPPGKNVVPPQGAQDYLTAKQLEGTGSLDLYTAIQHLRPLWLQPRGGYSVQGRATIAIFLDGIQQYGTVELLKNIRTADVRTVRFLNASDATTRYGTNMTAGAIEVTTKHLDRPPARPEARRPVPGRP